MSELIRSMFSRIARRYDLANTVLSFGMHHRWRRTAVRLAAPDRGAKVLDLATGTGDFAIAFARALGSGGEVVAGDFSEEMLHRAAVKTAPFRIRLVAADAMRLEFADNSFDISSIAFGIRNVDDPVAALREMHRVLKPGGKIVVLEFGQPEGFFGTMYNWYSRLILPFLGGIVSGDPAAYHYLRESSASFPCGEKFAALMKQAGIGNVKQRRMLFGAVYLYIGIKVRGE